MRCNCLCWKEEVLDNKVPEDASRSSIEKYEKEALLPRAKEAEQKNLPRAEQMDQKKLPQAKEFDQKDVPPLEEKPRKEDEMFLRTKDRKYIGMTQEEQGKWSEEFEFICMGDPQIGMGDQAKEEEFSRRSVKFINERYANNNIMFVVVCGDFTHNLEAFWSKEDPEGGRAKRLKELAAYKEIYRELDPRIPLVCVCGNHDVGNSPTPETIELYSKEFGDDYHTFWAGGVKFIAMNSQLVQHPDCEELAEAHDAWLEKELTADEATHLVVFAHIPPFCWDVNENDTNFNWPQERRKMWLDRMVKAGVRKMYCAHYHRKAQGTYEGLEVVVAGALGTFIKTKERPKDVEEGSLEDFNFRLSYAGFGGVETNEKTSGLFIVTVKESAVVEKWMSIADFTEEEKKN